MSRCRALVAAAVAAVGLSAAPGAATSATILSPGAWSVVDLGRKVPYELGGACASASVLVQATFSGGAVDGPASGGCTGDVSLPTASAIAAGGWTEGSALELTLVAGDATLPLRHKHLQPDLGAAVSGGSLVVPSLDDPADANSLVMAAGNMVDLGLVDLSGIYGIAMRAEGRFSFELRAGSATGQVVVSSNGGHSRIDWLIRPRSAGRERYQLTTAPVTGAPSGAVSLFLTVTDGLGVINFIDLTGSGSMTPHTFDTPLPDAISLFNGRDLDDWTQMGPGGFAVEVDGTLRADPPPAGQWGWLYYNKQTFKNFVLRLEFKIDGFGANSGVLVRHAATGEQTQSAFTAEEIQITDVNTEYTGGIDHVQTAVRQPQSSPGDWSTMEIVANGANFVVRVNGVVTSVYDGSGGCSLFALPCAGGEYGGYVVGGNGYIAVEAEAGHVWFRTIEVHDCAVSSAPPESLLLRSSDPLCAEAR